MIALVGQCVRLGQRIASLVLLLLVMPIAGLAAPYADYVIDARTGQVLHETNANTRLHPASLTKMMTLYIAFQAIEHGEISLDTPVTISKHAASMPPSHLGLRPGQRIALRYLIRAAAIKSANDAATAIAEALGGTDVAFAKRMTTTAKALGMSKTTFRNANGLTAEGHLSTAHDMTLLGRHLFYDFPQYYGIFSRRTADAGVAQVNSTNARFLNSYEGADGIKTGYTVPAGFNLVASAQRGNKRIIATIFGGTSTPMRNSRMTELLDLGFGKAPNKAAVQIPSTPDYMADASSGQPSGEDSVAMAVAASVSGSGDDVPGGAAKTLRVSGLIPSSPRPQQRPLPGATPATDPAAGPEGEDPAAVLMAMQSDINSVLAEAAKEPVFEQTTAPQPETSGLAAAALEDTTEPGADIALPDALPDALADALPDAGGDAVADALAQNAPAQPDPGAVATEIPTAEATTTGVTVADADDTMPHPARRPETAAPALPPVDVAAAEQGIGIEAAPADAEAGGATATGLVDATTLAEAEESAPAGDATESQSLAFMAAPPVLPTPAPPAAIVADAQTQKTVRPQPRDLSDQIILDPVGPAMVAAVEEPEVVTRISTSGGHQWGINIGNFPSRFDAEREMLHIALLENNALGDSLRKVVQRKGGFDANFLGLSQEAADLACRRLTARGDECSVVGP